SNRTSNRDHDGISSQLLPLVFPFSHEYLESLNKTFIAAQYVPNITHSLREHVEEESRQYLEEVSPGFNYSGIRDYLAYPNATFKGIESSPNRSFYFPIHYIAPIERNEVALDLDMYSFRKEEIDKAIETGKAVLGPRGKLLQEDHPDVYAVSLIHPGSPGHFHDDSSATSVGVSKIVIRIPDLIAQAAASTETFPSAVYIYDETPHRSANNDGEPIFLAAADITCCEPGSNKTVPNTELKRESPIGNISSARLSYTTTIHAADHT
ncbi:MAG: hypothetical protein SGILL_009653, partial [Bacillariaceae sp.]